MTSTLDCPRPKALGSVLPTPRSLALNERYAEDAQRRREALAASTPALANARRCEIGGEVRYYVDQAKYAVISHSGHRVLWFEVRTDGDYAIKR